MSAHQELSNFMWGICGHVFRSLLKPHEYGEAIPPLVILRRLDCVLGPQKDEELKLYSRYKEIGIGPTSIILDKVGTSFFKASLFDLKRLKQDPRSNGLNFDNFFNDDGLSETG